MFELCRERSLGDFKCYMALPEVSAQNSVNACPTGTHVAVVDDQDELYFLQDSFLDLSKKSKNTECRLSHVSRHLN